MLFVALLVLVVTVLAAVALVRTVDIGTLVAGNLAFRQAGMQATDRGIETARNWLLDQDDAVLRTRVQATAPFYFPTRNGGMTGNAVFDPTDPNWKAFWAASNVNITYKELTPADAAGNRVFYTIHRMCEIPPDDANQGDPAKSNCFTAGGIATGGTSQRIKEPGDLPCFNPNTGENLCKPTNPYYRITVMVAGPRGTAAFGQAVIY